MMNDHDLAAFLMILSGGLFTTTVAFAVLWIRARERALRSQLSPQGTGSAADELMHVVHAVDAIAIEVERISEAQRFATQTLVERLDLPTVARGVPERVITPH